MPGSPKTSVSPRTPNESGLPGLTATPQKISSTPSSASVRARDRELAHRNAAGGHEHVRLETARDRVAVRERVVLDDGQYVDVRARLGEHRGDHRAVRLVDLARTRACSSGPAELAARREDRDTWPRRADDLGETDRGESADLCCAPRRRPGVDDRVARRVRRPLGGARAAPARSGGVHRPGRRDPLRPRRERPRRHRPERLRPLRLPQPRPLAAGQGRANPRRHETRPAARPGVSAARTAKPSIAELGNGGRSIRATAGSTQDAPCSVGRRRTVSEGSATTRARIRARASSTVRSSPPHARQPADPRAGAAGGAEAGVVSVSSVVRRRGGARVVRRARTRLG